MSVHVSPKSTYWGVFLALMVLTLITVWVAFMDLGALNNVVAMSIAVCKAVLVVWFFMHVRHAGRLVRMVVVSGFFWLLLLFLFTLADYFNRGWLGVLGK